MKSKKNYIVILNFNVWNDAIEAIESVINNDYKNFQIILIDNCSSNDSYTKLKEWLEGKVDIEIEKNFFRTKLSTKVKRPLPYVSYTAQNILERDLSYEEDTFSKHLTTYGICDIDYPLLLVQTGKNLGFAVGNNVALKALIDSKENANVLLLNPDTFLDEKALSTLNNCPLETDRFLMGMSVKSYSDPEKLMSIGGNKIIKPLGIVQSVTDYKNVAQLDYIYGAALFMTTETLRYVGKMPEDYFLYWEETDWCYSAKKAGVALVSCPEAICYDKVGTSIGRGYFAEYFFTYNSILFYRKHFKHYLISLFLFHLMRFSVKLIKFKLPQAKAILFALKDYIFGERHEIK